MVLCLMVRLLPSCNAAWLRGPAVKLELEVNKHWNPKWPEQYSSIPGSTKEPSFSSRDILDFCAHGESILSNIKLKLGRSTRDNNGLLLTSGPMHVLCLTSCQY